MQQRLADTSMSHSPLLRLPTDLWNLICAKMHAYDLRHLRLV